MIIQEFRNNIGVIVSLHIVSTCLLMSLSLRMKLSLHRPLHVSLFINFIFLYSSGSSILTFNEQLNSSRHVELPNPRSLPPIYSYHHCAHFPSSNPLNIKGQSNSSHIPFSSPTSDPSTMISKSHISLCIGAHSTWNTYPL